MTAASSSPPSEAALLEALRTIARRAGDEILQFYGNQPERQDLDLRRKGDHSPVTAADEAAERLILPELQALLPGVPIVSEEAAAAGFIPEIDGPDNPRRRFWLVDPLDGTKEFLSGNGEFTVNIALIEGGRPVLGVVHLPTLNATYTGAAPGSALVQHGAAAPEPIAARRRPTDGAIVLASRSHRDKSSIEEFMIAEQISEQRIAGSSLKFCLVAEGVADLYPRFGRTMEWDTAAGHAVLTAAGGSVTTTDGQDLRYGKPGFENPHFIARGRTT
ncbi:3'(2'),5'-bisphosphate nucleotidase CysQ [Rhodospirillaceae bacterium SYSU D60014]|uniref:3'(2'),5'-bisphosphate nucleotidase CysQ n=1 Tax=Virgifigura deserti TaxID=2268457 RepID=UPI000E6653B4